MLLLVLTRTKGNPAARTSQPQEQILQLNSPTTNTEQTLPELIWQDFLPFVDNQMRNLAKTICMTFDMVTYWWQTFLMSLATGFDPMEVSWLLEETGYDSGLSLDSSNNSTSVIKSNSSHFIYVKVISSSSDLSHYMWPTRAVGGYYPEPSKLQGLHEWQKWFSFSVGTLHFNMYHITTLPLTAMH